MILIESARFSKESMTGYYIDLLFAISEHCSYNLTLSIHIYILSLIEKRFIGTLEEISDSRKF